MEITRKEVIKMELNGVLDMEALNRVDNMLKTICYSLGEESDYDLINMNINNVMSSKDIYVALDVINALLFMDNYDANEWRVERKG